LGFDLRLGFAVAPRFGFDFELDVGKFCFGRFC
jgi:hypothetical protein